MTPLQTYPPKQHRGRPGYSARHFAALDRAQDDPLRVAERLQSIAIGDQVTREAHRRLFSDSEPFSDVVSWQGQALTDRRAKLWEVLCGSWDELIAVLEAHRSKPGIQPYLTQARRDAKRFSTR